MTSQKKLSLPKMSRKSEAACIASRYWPRRRRVWTSPDGQPVVAIRPFEYRLSSSRSMRGHFAYTESSEAIEPILNRLCMPVLSSDSSVMWVYAPPPETSSPRWCGSPQRVLALCVRCWVPGVR